mmetsp:Transcript_27745/g.44412  ORF Transcript_27745/g.44412 Transcript_27745/m.44412 type:complete len:110 (+) Transcript_27745:1103-1432(+)
MIRHAVSAVLEFSPSIPSSTVNVTMVDEEIIVPKAIIHKNSTCDARTTGWFLFKITQIKHITASVTLIPKKAMAICLETVASLRFSTKSKTSMVRLTEDEVESVTLIST